MFNIAATMRTASAGLYDKLFPALCPCCSGMLRDNSDVGICPTCLRLLEKHPAERCAVCSGIWDHAAGFEIVCAQCLEKNFAFNAAFSFYRYAGIAKKCIHVGKFKRKKKLFETCGRLLADHCLQRGIGAMADTIVSVPIHAVKFRERGFNQAAILADMISGYAGIPHLQALRRTRNTRSQFALCRQARRENIARAFHCADASSVRAQRVLLVDDIFTSGATLDECARVLKQAQASAVIAVTFAH